MAKSQAVVEIDDSDDDFDARLPRRSRDMDARTAEPTITWRPSELLPDPPQMPGWGHRWIRKATQGHPDDINVQKAFREGWRVAPPSEYPELADYQLFGRSGNPDVIEFGGLILMRMPTEMVKQRDAYHANKAKRQIRSINARPVDAAGNDQRLQFESDVVTETKRTLKS